MRFSFEDPSPAMPLVHYNFKFTNILNDLNLW